MTKLKKQTFSPKFLRPIEIIGSLITLKSTLHIIFSDLFVSDSIHYSEQDLDKSAVLVNFDLVDN